ncbi:unnamed protein product [Oppiella nova]|uniref:Uncharacterized protein n=1 Tax=Oppiella nova TaxID=334625 RepID=A0A7R9QE97_9ACAR|nr:unnamed protein product [Oppiella nova]CAG2163587.1 unnamed protein product [Oppiella nova]
MESYYKLCVFMWYVLTSTSMSRAQVCSPGDLRKFDSNVAKLSMVGNSGRKFPENRGPELKKFCSENDKLISDVEKYRNQCLENMSKQLDTLLKIGACDKCYTAMLDKLLGIQISQDDKKKIPWLCW